MTLLQAPRFPGSLDNEARAELLCHLVVTQLVARMRTDNWLRTDHLVESTRIWLAGNGARANWEDCIQLGILSQKVAADFPEMPPFRDPASLAKLFASTWRLDYRSPFVRGIYAACEGELQPR